MKYLSAILLIVLSTSCTNLKPFTQSLQENHNWSESELKKIQFYLSEDIILSRKLKGGTQEIIKGYVKIIDGQKVEIIKINKGTPGVFKFKPKENRMAIQFENRTDAFLMFGPNPKYDNQYMLLASEWKRNGGKVTYEGNKYVVQNPKRIARLLIDLKNIDKREATSRTAKGVRVNKH